jgi:hypothetical protein
VLEGVIVSISRKELEVKTVERGTFARGNTGRQRYLKWFWIFKVTLNLTAAWPPSATHSRHPTVSRRLGSWEQQRALSILSHASVSKQHQTPQIFHHDPVARNSLANLAIWLALRTIQLARSPTFHAGSANFLCPITTGVNEKREIGVWFSYR